ncbi:GFA family protein [Pyxidicoccus trucidator]|uniref:GFA family protein n=1 Tax=Pyxidicoccus trucidator TaxID=2709662 RepID=UPI0013D913CA|nr:GFA family protein [Pyxidicoccus trucidator]
MSQTQNPSQSNVKTYAGRCLCGTVRFEAELDLTEPVSRCNCTFCVKVGATSSIVKPSALRVVAGAQSLGEFRKQSDSKNSRSFCKNCGTHCFAGGYVEEIGGDYRSVYVNCLDDVDLTELTIRYWDGRNNNWEAGMRAEPWPVRAQARA